MGNASRFHGKRRPSRETHEHRTTPLAAGTVNDTNSPTPWVPKYAQNASIADAPLTTMPIASSVTTSRTPRQPAMATPAAPGNAMRTMCNTAYNSTVTASLMRPKSLPLRSAGKTSCDEDRCVPRRESVPSAAQGTVDRQLLDDRRVFEDGIKRRSLVDRAILLGCSTFVR